jgi:hypothetical protein
VSTTDRPTAEELARIRADLEHWQSDPYRLPVSSRCLAHALTLLGEVDRLLALLAVDPAEEARLREIRDTLAGDSGGGYGRETVIYLLARLDAAEGRFADFLGENQAARRAGAAEERRRVLDEVRARAAGARRETALDYWMGWEHGLNAVTHRLVALPPLADPLPPEQARREQDRLAACMREALAQLAPSDVGMGGWHPGGRASRAISILRRALGEGQ